MSIIISNDGDKIVNTIAERDAIPVNRRFPGMMVTVKDAIGDPQTGGGFAKYEWFADGTNPRWILGQIDNKINLKFVTESKVIQNGTVLADNIPVDGTVWQVRIIDSVTGVILRDAKVTIDLYTLDIGTLDYDGQILEYTYGYGSFTAQLDSIIYELKDKATTITNPVIDLKEAALFKFDVTQNTTFSVVNVEVAPIVDSFILELNNGGAFTVTWPANVEWDSGVAPALTTTGKDMIAFFTYDNGLTWKGVIVGSAMAVVA
jgi:hypothetical protein